MRNIYLRHLTALVTFVVLAAAFNAPVFSGKTLQQNDIKQYQGSSAEIKQYREQEDRQILWTNAMFSGMPTYVISAVYGGELLHKVPKIVHSILMDNTVGYLFLLMLSFYLLAHSFKLDWRIGIIGGIAYAFSTYFIIVLAAGHNAKIHAMAYLPGMLAGMVWAYRQRKYLTGAAVFALFTGLELGARHPQMFYYFLFVMLFYGIYELVQAWQDKWLPSFLKATGALLIAGILGVLTNLPYLSNTYDYGKHTIRGKSELTLGKENKTEGLDRDYATAWSYGIAETWSLLIPNFKGGATEALQEHPETLNEIDPRFKQSVGGLNSYFGNQPFTSGPVYVGAVVMLLALLTLFLRKGALKYVFLAVIALTVALSWGKNLPGLTNFFLDNVPLYNKFRAVASILIVPEVLLPLLAMLGLSTLLKFDNKDSWNEKVKLLVGGAHSRKKLLLIVTGVLLLFTLINYMAPGTFNDFLSDQEATQLPQQLAQAGFNDQQASQFIGQVEQARQALFKQDVLRSFGFILVAGLLLFLFQRGGIKQNVFLLGIGVLILADLFMVNRRYLNTENFVDEDRIAQNYGVQPSRADQMIQAQYQNDPYFRTLNLAVSPFNDASTSFFHYSIGGYHGAKLKIYQELIEYQLGGEIEQLRQSLQNQSIQTSDFKRYPALNMLNTRYVIINPQGPPLENPTALGNAWLVSSIKEVADADAEIQAIAGLDAKNEAVLRSDQMAKFGSRLGAQAGQGSVSLTSYDPEKLSYRYDAPAENLVVFSEVWYPENWVATIDGEETELLRANYVLRALKVPAGEHTITLEYRDSATGIKNTIAMISSLIILLGVPVLLFLSYRSKKNEAAA